MADEIYIKTTMTIPQVGTSTHVAELKPIDNSRAHLLRIIELDPLGGIGGAGTPHSNYGLAAAPEEIVPHPDTYANFPDITTENLGVEEFEKLWSQAEDTFPTLGK